MAWLERQIKELKAWAYPKHLLLVLDDVIAELMLTDQKQLRNLIFNRRHLLGAYSSISMIVTSQKYSDIPKFIRQMVTDIYLFHIPPE